MMRKVSRIALVGMMLGLSAVAGWSETLEDAYGLGNHAPKPEEWTKINQELSVRARVLDEAGNLAETARRGDVLRLGLEFYVQPGAKDRPITLECGLYFYDATGEQSDYRMSGKPCYSGRLHDGLEKFQPIDLDFRFINPVKDPLGTAAIVVRVTDTQIGDGVSLAPTYRLQKEAGQ